MLENNVQSFRYKQYLLYLRNLTDLALNRFTWEFPEELKSISTRYFETALINNGIAGLCLDVTTKSFLSLYITPQTYNIYEEPITVIGQGYNYNKKFYEPYFEYCYNNRQKDSSLIDIQRYATMLANIDTTLYFLTNKMKQPYIIKAPKDLKLTSQIIMNKIENSDIIELDEKYASMCQIEVLNLPIDNANVQSLQDYKSSLLSEILTILGVNNVETEKKERLLTDEVNANNEKISRYMQSALTERQEFCERVMNKFNLEIKVLVNSNNQDIVMGDNNGMNILLNKKPQTNTNTPINNNI